MKKLSQMRNLGEKSARMLAEAGIETEDDLRKIGVVEAYHRVRHANPGRISLLMLYALQGALMDVHWNQVPVEIKDQLKAQSRQS